MGYKQVTIRHLSEELDLNQSTICRALKNSSKIGKNTIDKVKQYAKLRGYNVDWRNLYCNDWKAARQKADREKKKVTIYDIAKYMSISPTTVSRALNDGPGIGKKTTEAAKQVAKEMGYTPNLNARLLRMRLLEQQMPGRNLPVTVHTIAKQLKLSASTVSRALLNDRRVSDQTKNCVIAFANEKGYIASETARNLKTGNHS